MKTNCCHTSNFESFDMHVICTNDKCDNYLNTTGKYKDFTKVRYIISITVFVFSILFTFDDYSKADKSRNHDLVSLEDSWSVPVSIENIETELKKNEVICYREVIAQIKLESGNLSSFLMRRTNNMLGMRYPVKRKTTACGIYLPESDTIIIGNTSELKKYAGINNYAVYKTWQDAIADYALWQQSNFKVKEKYVEFLGRVYAQDSSYTSKIKNIASRIK